MPPLLTSIEFCGTQNLDSLPKTASLVTPYRCRLPQNRLSHISDIKIPSRQGEIIDGILRSLKANCLGRNTKSPYQSSKNTRNLKLLGLQHKNTGTKSMAMKIRSLFALTGYRNRSNAQIYSSMDKANLLKDKSVLEIGAGGSQWLPFLAAEHQLAPSPR